MYVVIIITYNSPKAEPFVSASEVRCESFVLWVVG